jgi:hypothetical protein
MKPSGELEPKFLLGYQVISTAQREWQMLVPLHAIACNGD